MASMGLSGFEKKACKRLNRWTFEVEGFIGEMAAMPPQKTSKPNYAFKEMEVEHVSETVFFPAKADWRTITIVVYDFSRGPNPLLQWIKKCYDPSKGSFKPGSAIMAEAKLKQRDGCGNDIETWTFEDSWPSAVNFGSLDMGSAEIVTCEITLRYARAYS